MWCMRGWMGLESGWGGSVDGWEGWWGGDGGLRGRGETTWSNKHMSNICGQTHSVEHVRSITKWSYVYGQARAVECTGSNTHASAWS